MEHFCTYFDSRFLPRAMALYHSLQRHAKPMTLHALCLDDAAYDTIAGFNDPNLRALSLEQLEQAYPKLRDAKRGRSLVEYYFTCTPALPLYVLDHVDHVNRISYVDADLYFFDSPAAIFDAMGDGSTLIIAHRYPPHLWHLEQFGRFNVGLVSFRNDRPGRACLGWWHRKCIAWCYEQVEDDRFADQKYLDAWPRLFEGVIELEHRGANLAPWNLSNYDIHQRGRRVFVNDEPLIFYHFHRLRRVGPCLYDPGLANYGASANRVVRDRVYAPYVRHVRRLAQQLPAAREGNLRLAGPRTRRELLRCLLYDHTLLQVGPFTGAVHLEPLARPLLWLRDRAKRAA